MTPFQITASEAFGEIFISLRQVLLKKDCLTNFKNLYLNEIQCHFFNKTILLL